jgi:hypothetical protein
MSTKQTEMEWYYRKNWEVKGLEVEIFLANSKTKVVGIVWAETVSIRMFYYE